MKGRLKHQRLVLIGVVAVVLCTVAYVLITRGRQADSSAGTVVRIGTFQTAIDYSPYIVARQKGWIDEALREQHARPEYLPTFQSLPTVNESIAADQLDVVLTGEVPTIVGRAAGIDERIAWLSCRLKADTIVPKASGANSIKDLKGKRIAVLAGSGPYYWFVRDLEKVGLSKEDVNLIDMLPPDAKAAFETGAVDAWAMFPPWPEQEIVAGSARTLPDFDAPIQVLVSVRGKFAAQHSAALVGFLGALDRAKQWLIENPDQAQAMVSTELNLPLPVVKLSWTKLDWRATLDTKQVLDIAEFMKKEGFVKNAVDRDGLFLPGVTH